MEEKVSILSIVQFCSIKHVHCHFVARMWSLVHTYLYALFSSEGTYLSKASQGHVLGKGHQIIQYVNSIPIVINDLLYTDAIMMYTSPL